MLVPEQEDLYFQSQGMDLECFLQYTDKRHRKQIDIFCEEFPDLPPHEVALTYLQIHGQIDMIATVKSNVAFFAERYARRELTEMAQRYLHQA